MSDLHHAGRGGWRSGWADQSRGGRSGAGAGGGCDLSRFDAQIDVVRTAMPFRVVGQVQGISGLTIEAAELPLPVGSLCRISSFGAQSSIAEVIGFKHGRTLLMPLSQLAGVSAGDKVENI